MRTALASVVSALKTAGDRYRILVTALVVNIPLISAIFLINLSGVKRSAFASFYSQTVMGYYMLPLLVIVTVIFLLAAPLRRTLFTICGAIFGMFLVYLLLDSLVFRVSRVHIDFFWIEFMIHDFGGVGFPRATIVAAIGALMLSLLLQVGIFRFAARFPLTWSRTVAAQLVIVLAFGASQILHIVAHEQNDYRITSLTPLYPLYVPFTSHSNADRYGEMIPLLDIGEAHAQDSGQGGSLRYPQRPLQFDEAALAAESDPPNVLFILLESWRFDMMNETVSPHIQELADRSTVCLNHISSGNQTTCGVFGIFYGLHATYWTAVKANNALIDNSVLMDVMKDRDYAFGVYADSSFDRHKVKDTMFAGIEVHEDFAGDGVPEKDRDLTDQLKNFITEQSAAGRPFMAFAFYKSTHYSYYYPREHRIFEPAKDLQLGFTGGDTEPEKYLNDYMNAVHYNDALVGEVVAYLEEIGELDNTVIILTTDHGEEFNDNAENYWGHGSNYTRYQTQVPLILYAPGRAPARIEQATGHVDLVPTLMQEYFHCTNDPADYSNGRDLFTLDAEPRPFVIGSYFNHAFLLGEGVYEVSPTGMKRYSLRNIDTPVGMPDSGLMRRVLDEINRFYGPPPGDRDPS